MEPLKKWWCKHFHRQVFRPVNGMYRCGECLRTWPVPWQEPPSNEMTAAREQVQSASLHKLTA